MNGSRWMILLVAVLVAQIGWSADVATVSHGEEVRLEDHLAAGRYTLFDFYADWCGPCRVIGPKVERLVAAHSDRLALRKVDIVDWSSPVARQFGLSSIPHFKLVNPDGHVVAQGDAGRVLAAVDRVLAGGDSSEADEPARRRWGGYGIAGILAVVAAAALRVGLRRGSHRRGPPTAGPPPTNPVQAEPSRPEDPDDPAIWFVMVEESLEGPYSRAGLNDLRSDGRITRAAKVRRRGEVRWTPLDELLRR